MTKRLTDDLAACGMGRLMPAHATPLPVPFVFMFPLLLPACRKDGGEYPERKEDRTGLISLFF